MKKLLLLLLIVGASFSTFAHSRTHTLKKHPIHAKSNKIVSQAVEDGSIPPFFILPCFSGINIIFIQNGSGQGPQLLTATDYAILWIAFYQVFCGD